MTIPTVNREKLLKTTELNRLGVGGVIQYLLLLEEKLEKTPTMEVLRANLRGEKGDSYILTTEDKQMIARVVLNSLDKEELAQLTLDSISLDDIASKVVVEVPEPVKGDKGDSIKGDKGDSIKGDKGDKGDNAFFDYEGIRQSLIDHIDEKVGQIVLPENTAIDVDGIVKEIKQGLGGSTARNFYQLFDTPSGFNGSEGFDVRVREDGKGLEFYDKTAEGVVHNYVAVSDTYTILVTDVTVNCTANTFTVTLPTAVGVTGQKYYIKNSGTGIVTVEGDGTETVDDQLNQSLIQYEALTVISNGSGWIIV